MSKRNMPKAPALGRPAGKSEVNATAADRWNPDIRAAADAARAATSISVLDPIGADMFGDGVTVKRIMAVLRGAGDVVVNINSPGGDFFEGLAIYTALQEHSMAGNKVTVHILGLAASAASIIAMAGDEILMARASFLMIHNTWVVAAGDRHTFGDVINNLQSFDAAAASIYAARTGMPEAEISAMLDRETWIGGQGAVDQGFADGLLESAKIETAHASGDFTPMAAQKKLDLYLATGSRATKSERRALVAALKDGGTPRAAPDGMSGAAVTQLAQSALAKLNTL